MRQALSTAQVNPSQQRTPPATWPLVDRGCRLVTGLRDPFSLHCFTHGVASINLTIECDG